MNHAVHDIHHVDGRALLALTPHTDQELLRDIKRAVAEAAWRTDLATWQDAWNHATGATPRHPGRLSLHAHTRCPTCNGRRIDMRLGRPCHNCLGRGRTYRHITVTALYAPPPVD